MKKKTVVPRLSVCSLLLMALLAYNNSGAQPKSHAGQKTSNNWITMDITFKPNTNEESRDKAIRAIEKMWIKSAAPFRKKYPNLHPSITVTTAPTLDTLKYRLSLLSTFYSKSDSGGYSVYSMKVPIVTCPPCPGLCPKCDSTNSATSANYRIERMVFH